MSFWMVLLVSPEFPFEPSSAGGVKTRSTGSGRLRQAFGLGLVRLRVASRLVFIAFLVQLFPILFEPLDLTIQPFSFAFEHFQLLSQGFGLPLGADRKST